MKILLLDDPGSLYTELCRELGTVVFNPSKAHAVDLIVFTGGEDVNPILYGELALHSRTRINPDRDRFESIMFKVARLNKIPMIGICRGAQFLCAMSDGKVIQDVTFHALNGTHEVVTNEGVLFQVTSSHHQMMFPWEVNHELLAWAVARSSWYEDGDEENYKFPSSAMMQREGIPVVKEPEVVWFKDTKALGFQYHPEWMNKDTPGYSYFLGTVSLFLEQLNV